MDQEWTEYENGWFEDDLYFPETEAAPLVPLGSCLVNSLPLLAVIITSCFLAFVALNWTSPVIAISIKKSYTETTENEDRSNQIINQSKHINNSKSIAPLFTQEVQYWNDLIIEWADFYSIDPNLIASIMQIESCGDFAAQSYAGARGLFQVMPYHFKSNEDPFDPETNAKRGIAYLLNALQARDGDARLALASYNGGIYGASRPEEQWPSETQRYTYWGYGIYADAVEGKKNSQHLQEWLAAGGAGLCAQASQRIGITN